MSLAREFVIDRLREIIEYTNQAAKAQEVWAAYFTPILEKRVDTNDSFGYLRPYSIDAKSQAHRLRKESEVFAAAVELLTQEFTK